MDALRRAGIAVAALYVLGLAKIVMPIDVRGHRPVLDVGASAQFSVCAGKNPARSDPAVLNA